MNVLNAGERGGLIGALFLLMTLGNPAGASSPDTQLVDAARNGDVAEAKDALTAGARINTKLGPSALFQCLGAQPLDHTLEMIQLLLDQGADINAAGPDGVFTRQAGTSRRVMESGVSG